MFWHPPAGKRHLIKTGACQGTAWSQKLPLEDKSVFKVKGEKVKVFGFILIRVNGFLGVDCPSLTEDCHHMLFRCESVILSGTLDFFWNSFKFRLKRCEWKSTLKVDENEFQWGEKWTCWVFTTSKVEFVTGSSPALLAARAAFPQHHLAQTPYVQLLRTLPSSQECDLFSFNFNYLDCN